MNCLAAELRTQPFDVTECIEQHIDELWYLLYRALQ